MARWVETNQRGGAIGLGIVCVFGIVVISWAALASPSNELRIEPSRTESRIPEDVGIPEDRPTPGLFAVALAEGNAEAARGRPADGMAPKAEASYQGNVSPGERIVLSAAGSRGADLRYQWVQTQGPRAILESPGQSTTGLTVPAGADVLGFSLVVANAGGMDAAKLEIPVHGRDPSPRAKPDLHADAGDDQLALLGRQVTLNGLRSEPRDAIGYRWIQVGGPKVRMFIEDRYIYSFIPHLPGIYRFALVVGSGQEISEPDTVTVTVATTAATGMSMGTAAAAASGPSAEGPAEGNADLARRVLASVRGGEGAADALAEVFALVADRMDLYQSYSEMFSEISRRLETILPSDPAQRNLWTERIFTPLTARMIERMLPEGLDLRRPEAHSAELTLGQRAKLAELFREVAEGFLEVKVAH